MWAKVNAEANIQLLGNFVEYLFHRQPARLFLYNLHKTNKHMAHRMLNCHHHHVVGLFLEFQFVVAMTPRLPIKCR